MPLVEDPAHLSKTRLKSDLVAHNVELPPAASKKEVYVELHLKNIDQKYSADFSSDEEDPVQDVADKHPENPELPDPHSLTDNELKATLLKYGVKAGPIIASTRSLYERKLRKLLQSEGHEELNEVEKAGLYSDTEEEDGNEEGDEESEQEQEETVRSNQRRSTEPPEEPLNEILKDIFPDTKTTPTGIYATSRRPIKGAAQRPIKYSYPDTPVSPLTLERQELEHRLVPIKIQILVFFIVMLILYFIYVHVEDSGGVLTLLDSLVSDDADGILFQDETLDTYDIGQE